MSYIIANITIHDSETYQKYVDGNRDIFKKFGAEVILVEEHPKVLEGTLDYGHIVLVKFPRENDAQRFYDSPEYQENAKIRWGSSDSTLIIAREGFHHHIQETQ